MRQVYASYDRGWGHFCIPRPTRGKGFGAGEGLKAD